MPTIIDGTFILERFDAKGGWTFVALPAITTDRKKPFGMIPLSGSIDGFPVRKIHVMPMGDGRLFLPVKAAIRKAIGKKQGDRVHVILFEDDSPLEIPGEISLYLSDDPEAQQAFLALTEGQQKMYLDWIYAAKKQETKINRIALMMNRVVMDKKYPGN